jgi:hypothetical protein
MFKMGLHDPFGVLKNIIMAKRRVENQIVNLILNHQKLGITPIYSRVGGVLHIFGKLSMRATTLL